MPKNIVVCCDGTGNEYCKNKTNVAKLFDAVENHTERQIAYYDPGVGTLGSTLAITWFGKKLSWLFGLAFAFGLPKNIEDAYSFLMENYEEGDRVFLFGFSRGAYTVRALAGMIMKCGLLHKEYPNLIEYATKLYRNRSLDGKSKKVQDFRRAFSRTSCVPHFIGVWDTVKSVGVRNKIRFSDTRLSESIPCGYHALSIDEKRFKFRPVLWDEPGAEGQVIEQVWFPGVHCDVGGSYEEAGLSDAALKWMLKRAASQGLIVKMDDYDRVVPDCTDTIHESFKGFWLLLWFYLRPIKENAAVHVSAIDRMEKVAGYRPRRLRKVRDRVRIVDEEMES
jgi:uncharacterized protein (DUF2235 family)